MDPELSPPGEGRDGHERGGLHLRREARHPRRERADKSAKKESLPDGKLYWNIADRTIRPLLTEVHRRVNDAAAAVLAAENKRNGIGLKPMRGPWPENRVKDLIDKIVEVYAEEEADGQ